jgi:hypothetical protein
METINYNELKTKLNIIHLDDKCTISEKNVLLETYDGISHDHSQSFLLNASLLSKKGDVYEYMYMTSRKCSVMSDIKMVSTNCDVDVVYDIGGVIYLQEDIDDFISIAAMFQPFCIKIIFKELPKINMEFTFSAKYYFLTKKLNETLTKNKIKTKHITYDDGLCVKTKFDYKKFRKELRIHKCICSSSSLDALELLIGIDSKYYCGVKYHVKDNILFNSKLLNKGDDGSYYFEYIVSSGDDLIGDIDITSTTNNISFEYYIDSTKYSKLDEFVNSASSMSQLIIRVILSELPLYDTDCFTYNSTNYLINTKKRDMLARYIFKAGGVKYKNGHCTKSDV